MAALCGMTSPSLPIRLKDFLRELKRRKVYRVGAMYVVVGLAVAQGAQWLFEIIGLPDVAARVVAIVVLLGLPVALVLAWAYELRPDEAPVAGRPTSGMAVPRTEDGRPSDREASIVVLPFDNISPDPSDAYFADGLTEEITASLSAVRDLRVTSRNSATVLKQAGKGTRSIGAELGVAYLLEGSVRKAGDALRVTAQLIRVDTDEHLWSERYDGALSDVFGVQEEVARSIVRTLELHLRPEEDRRLAAHPMDDVRAYESYLKAREASLKWTREAQEHALELLQKARAQTGENAVIEAGIGYVYSQFANIGEHDRDYMGLAEEHARRALELDPANAEAHMVLGFLYQFLGDVDRSVHHLERSLEIKPDDSHALLWYSLSLSMAGRNEELNAAAGRLMEVDPLNPISHGIWGYALQIHGDLQGGLEEIKTWSDGSPPGDAARFFYAHALATVERHDEALTILREEFGPEAEGWSIPTALLLKAALEEDPEGMDAVLTEQARVQIVRDLMLSFYTASIFALAGRAAEARQWLRSAVDGGFKNYPWMARHDPWLSRYRDHPEFQALFEQVRKAWERQEGDRVSDSTPA